MIWLGEGGILSEDWNEPRVSRRASKRNVAFILINYI